MDDNKQQGSTRREFMQTSAAVGAAVAVPYIFTSQARADHHLKDKMSVAAVGVGGSRGRYNRGGSIARNAGKFGQLISVCDVDDLHAEEFSNDPRWGRKLTTYRDYRDMLAKEKPDIVTIGTPDHWHVPIAVAALQSGAHVYCEKPLTLTIEEGKLIRQVVADTGKVFQVGTQQRSENGLNFLKAIAIVKSGRLGKNANAYVAIGGAPGEGPFENSPAPDNLDWNMWVGPAPEVPYCNERRSLFRWFFEYSGGKMTDWGAHHIDIAMWALGHDHGGPVSIIGKGQFPKPIPDDVNWVSFLNGESTLPNSHNTATNFNIDLKFADGSLISVNDNYKRDDGRTEFGNGILFEGDEGRIFVNRGKLTGGIVENLSDKDNEQIDAMIHKLYRGKEPGDHMRNFFECIEKGGEPISDVRTHHRIMTACHLCNISLMLGRELKWDPQAEDFGDDAEANALMTRKRRAPFDLEASV